MRARKTVQHLGVMVLIFASCSLVTSAVGFVVGSDLRTVSGVVMGWLFFWVYLRRK